MNPSAVSGDMPRKAFRLTGRHVLAGFIAFFGLIFAVNGVFVYFALDSWSGLVVDRAYQRGLDYNKTLDRAEAQKALGWQSTVSLPATGGTARAEITDRYGLPVTGLVVEMAFRRPTHEGFDLKVTAREVAEGRYEARPNLALPGRWQMTVNARDAYDRRYRLTHNLVVAP